MIADQPAAEEYREIAGRSTGLVEGVPDDGWERPSPVPEWTARDVVRHLVESSTSARTPTSRPD